jgi:hypothetical protein
VRVVGLAGQLVEKAAGRGRSRLAPFHSREGERHRQAILGARDPDVAQPAFFVDRRTSVAIVFDAAMVRQQSLLHADQVDLRKFQPLGAVQRHQGDRVARKLRILVALRLAAGERNLVEKLAQVGPLGFSLVGG